MAETILSLFDYILTLFGVTALWLTLRGNPWGYAVGLTTQTLWLTYSLVTREWGFLGSCFIYTAVYLINLSRWYRLRTKRAAETTEKAELEPAAA
jgi:nicotinamide riboside transporter PnuC